MLGRFGTIIIIAAIDLNLEIRLNVSLAVSSHLHWAYGPINIRPYYPLDEQRWGLIGDLTASF